MPVEPTTPHRRRPLSQNIIPCDLNELLISSTYTEDPAIKRRRRKRKPLRVSKRDDPDQVRPQSPLNPSGERERSESPLFPPEELEHPQSPQNVSEEADDARSPLLPPQLNEVEVNTSAWERGDEIMAEPSPEPEGAVVLDPEYSDRQYYREPLTGFQREIWRPGDGDGSQSTEYYQRTGPVLPIEQRWRLFQNNIGPIGLGQDKTEPPRFVFLDDRAAHEVLTSDIQRARLNREWPHDFSANGKIRARRTHCGRPAIKDPLTSEYHSTVITKTLSYTFTGEKDYKPVIYRVPVPEPAEPTVEELIKKRKAEEAADPSLYNPRGHGHNQYTPRDMMVKFGAPTFSRRKPKGEDSEMLAKLKAMAPNVHVKDKLIPRVTFGDTVSNAGSVRSKAKTVWSEELQSTAAITPENGTAYPMANVEDFAYGAPQQDQNECDWQDQNQENEQEQNEENDSDSDTDLFPKHKTPARRAATPASTVAAGLEVPRQMGYIERRVHEQALAQETMNAVQNQDDVVRIAGELAEANVALADQAREIQRLRQDLQESQSAVRDLQGAIKDQQRVMDEKTGDDGSLT